MKALSICSTLGLVLVLGGCASLASKPKTFDQLGQFTAYPLNKQIFRVSFQAGNQFNYGTAEEITLVLSVWIFKTLSCFLVKFIL